MNKERSKMFWVLVFVLASYVLCGFAFLVYLRFVPDGNFSDMFSLGQLILEAVLLPAAVLGLWMAAEEFRKSRRRPRLYLAWDDEVLTHNKKLSLHLKRPDLNSANTPDRLNHSIALHNDGDNVATWYSIHLAFPVELLGRQNIPHYWSAELLRLLGFYREYGGEEHWIRKHAPSTQDDIFQSNGTLASYPQQRITLGSLKFLPIPEGEGGIQRYRIGYKIFTDAGPSRIDSLELIIHWTD